MSLNFFSKGAEHNRRTVCTSDADRSLIESAPLRRGVAPSGSVRHEQTRIHAWGNRQAFWPGRNFFGVPSRRIGVFSNSLGHESEFTAAKLFEFEKIAYDSL
jgi:hypothetical protein